MNAIDTNILVYLFDPSAPLKQVRAQQLLDDLGTQAAGNGLVMAGGRRVSGMLKESLEKGRARPRASPGRFPQTLATVRAQASHGTDF